MERSPVSVLTVRTGLQHRTAEDAAMEANCSTVARLGVAHVLTTASVAGPAGRAVAVPTHEPTAGGDGGAHSGVNLS